MEKGEQLWTAWEMHRFAVTTWASPASAVTSFGTGHALKGDGASSNPTLRASTPTTGEEALTPTGHGAMRGPCLTPSAGPGLQNTNHIPIKGITASRLGGEEVAGIHTKTGPHTKNTGLPQSTHDTPTLKTPLQDHSRKCFS